MQLREIEYLVAVKETGSLTAAANKMYVSQPALSQAIKKLEWELGITILERSSNSIRLSDAGELLAQEGKKLLSMASDVIKKVQDESLVSQKKLAIGITPLYGQAFFAEVYRDFMQQHPQTVMKIVESQAGAQEQLILDRTIDIGIFERPSENPSIESIPIYDERMVLLVDDSNPINEFGFIDEETKMPFMPLERIKDVGFVGYRHDGRNGLSDKTRSICLEHGFLPNVVYETSYSFIIRSVVSSGIGIGLTSYMSIYGLPLDSGSLKLRHYNVTGRAAERTYYCSYLKDSYLSSIASSFVDSCMKTHDNIVSRNPEMQFFIKCKGLDWSSSRIGKNRK